MRRRTVVCRVSAADADLRYRDRLAVIAFDRGKTG